MKRCKEILHEKGGCNMFGGGIQIGNEWQKSEEGQRRDIGVTFVMPSGENENEHEKDLEEA